jgi:hypothetical protein
MPNYDQRIKLHLASYKITRLGVGQNGFWKRRDNTYPHILPEQFREYNILEPYRNEFWKYYAEQEKLGTLKLHRDFHHLNSSQAMCFNLFFPFVHDNSKQHLLLEILGFNERGVKEIDFERIADPEEGTNFDFYLKLTSDRRVFFELKLSENDFGMAKPDQRHLEKLRTIYEPCLAGKVPEECLHPDVFFQHYQILRNISYVDSQSADRLFFIFPRKNEKLSKGEEFIRSNLSEHVKEKVAIYFLEDLVQSILNLSNFRDAIFRTYYLLFKEKYIL